MIFKYFKRKVYKPRPFNVKKVPVIVYDFNNDRIPISMVLPLSYSIKKFHFSPSGKGRKKDLKLEVQKTSFLQTTTKLTLENVCIVNPNEIEPLSFSTDHVHFIQYRKFCVFLATCIAVGYRICSYAVINKHIRTEVLKQKKQISDSLEEKKKQQQSSMNQTTTIMGTVSECALSLTTTDNETNLQNILKLPKPVVKRLKNIGKIKQGALSFKTMRQILLNASCQKTNLLLHKQFYNVMKYRPVNLYHIATFEGIETLEKGAYVIDGFTSTDNPLWPSHAIALFVSDDVGKEIQLSDPSTDIWKNNRVIYTRNQILKRFPGGVKTIFKIQVK